MKEYWRSAAKELRTLKSVTGAALMCALSPVLDLFTIVINQFLRISFTSLTHAVNGFMYGPLLACLAGGVADIVKYMLKPVDGFFIGFTVNEMLVGLLYGLFFYKKKITLPRVIAVRLIVTFGINLTLTPLWLSIMYGNAYKFMVATRIIKNIILIPIDVFILYNLMKFCEKHLKRNN